MADDCELLFFDTFSHDTCEELNLDLVQFPRPVYIFEIRIIPLGARVQADFPGGHRLGATNPSSFQLEFFVNDLSKRSASTFERLGSMEYKQNVDIQFPVPNKVPTDGLVLRGWYSAVTLAVYGVITKTTTKERSSPPPPPPPQVNSRQPSQEHCAPKEFESPIADTSVPEWERQPRLAEVPPEPPPPPVRSHPPVVDPGRFEVPQIIHQQPDQHVGYPPEIPPAVIGGFSEPPPPIVYQECVPVPQVPQVAAPPPPVYSQYETHYQKPWPAPEEQYQPPTEQYDHQMYNRPPEGNIYPPTDSGRPMWESKDHHATDMPSHEHDSYVRPGLLDHPIHREKDLLPKDRGRDRPWDRDIHDYKDDDNRLRDHDSKRKDRERRSREASWERNTIEPERYRDRDRDRDRIRDSGSRDRDRDRERNRDRAFLERGLRKEIREVKRPTTPPSPRKNRPHTPPTPPDMGSGPRTPKEDEPMEMYDDRGEGDAIHHTNFYEPIPREHLPGEHMYNLSEGEIQEGDNTEEDDGYEEIVSEEEDMSDVDDRTLDMSEIEYDLSDETWNFMSSFSPYNCELTNCQHFLNPTLFNFEIVENGIPKENKNALEEKSVEANKILESLTLPADAERTERWVDTLESITETTLSSLLYLKSKEKFEEIIDVLISWVVEGLDFELALKQPQTAYKVRHLKAGIRLATLMFQTKADIIKKLLDKDIPKYLVELFEQPYMVLPVKLLILRGIDAVISTQQGMEYVVNKPLQITKSKDEDVTIKNENTVQTDSEESTLKTCYQKLLEFLVSKQLTRAVVSLSALLNKIHLYEILLELSESIEKVVQNTVLPDPKTNPSDSPDNVEPRAVSVEPDLESSESISNSSEALTQVIISCLQETISCYRNAWKTVAQTKRYLPARTQFEFPKSPFDPYPGLLRMFKENKLLENAFVLFSSPALSGHPVLLTTLKDFFMELLSTQEGMLFLLSSSEVVNGIQKALLHTVDEAREEATEENTAQNLGMQLAYHLQTMLYIDCLMAYHARESTKKVLDEPDTVSALHHMYTMIFSLVGRSSVVNVLTTAENLNALLPFVQMSGDEPLDIKQSKSVCTAYVTELLLLVVQYSENVPTLEKFSDALYNLSQQEVTPKLHDLGSWMSPTRSISSYNHEAVASLMTVLKSHCEDAAQLPAELITALRILQYLTVPTGSTLEENAELKYMYAIIQAFSNDGTDSLKGILQNICDTYLKPSHQSPALVGLQGVLVVAIVKPSISILRAILAHLILGRGTEFKDLTAVPILLKVFSLMLLIPTSSFSYQIAQNVQTEIIEALLTYTQPFLGSAESEEALSKSLWTEMVQEILKYTKLSPSNFMTGLTILSELLPLPLPLQTREPLAEEEILKMVNYRKLWSAHLHSLSGIIQEVIVSLAATSCHPLQQLLRRVCVQLADLSAPTALFIVRAVLDALLETLILLPPDQKENLDPITNAPQETPTPMLKTPTSFTARILTLVAYLVSHASFKIPMMHILRGSSKADEKYLDVLPLMLELFNTPSEKPCVIQCQECIVSILQSLCDPDIGFITFESGSVVNDVLSSCLPCKEQISQICGALVQHIGCHQHSYSSVLPSLRSLVMLTEHDYGYFHVKQGLDLHPRAVYSLFTRFSLSFSKDSSDCLSTLSTTLEFLRLMVNGYEDGAQTGRSILLSMHELAELLRGDASGSRDAKEGAKGAEPFQPVVELAKLLTEFGNDEEAVESLLESISGLLSLLNSAAAKEGKPEKEIAEPVLSAPESMSTQFASRPVFIVGDVEEGRLSPAYWLAIPGADDADQDQEQVHVDLLAIAEKNIPGEFDLKGTLENLCLSTDEDMDLKSKKKAISTIGGKRKYQPLVNPALVDVNNKRPFIAPMRGRGFTRATSHSSRANDPFRSRPPNTSRPPSMHVDDFVALESHHSGNKSQPQTNRTPKEGSRGGRGRGFERNQVFPSTRGTGGRFFSPPGPYGRRESNRGGNRGTTRLSNNAWGSRSNPNSGQKLSPGGGQRGSFGGHRCDYNSPFNQQDGRPAGQRNRDSYTDMSRPSNVIPLNRFNRGPRVVGGMGQNTQGHWQDRNKTQNQRYYW
ncbi:protein virilizer homolog isoform X2 [Uloborus diversus]|uniref:protein virilizer homolog isoform X2 n=1 Tax=Uloborus diversus TaxID=327109 RepID=UPI00240954AA|nr:protein virilizer homolog isoform X2 [Uloborus diversus]